MGKKCGECRWRDDDTGECYASTVVEVKEEGVAACFCFRPLSKQKPPRPERSSVKAEILHKMDEAMEDSILKWFGDNGEPWVSGSASEEAVEHIKSLARLFRRFADTVEATIDPGPERTVALRKLLEAKDAAVRAVVHPGG